MHVDSVRSCVLRTLAAAAAGALLLCSGAAGAGDDARASVRATVRRAGAAYAELERNEVEKLSQAVDRLAKDDALLAPFIARDREKVLATAKPIFEKLKTERGVTHWYFIEKEPARTCFLRVHAPSLHGDVIERATLSQAIATHQIGFGKELGKTAFALRVVKPVSSGGKLVGYMELGEEIDHFFGRMKAQTGDDFGLLVDKARIDRKELARIRHDDRWEERPDVVLIESTMWDDKHIDLGGPLKGLTDDGTVVRRMAGGFGAVRRRRLPGARRRKAGRRRGVRAAPDRAVGGARAGRARDGGGPRWRAADPHAPRPASR